MTKLLLTITCCIFSLINSLAAQSLNGWTSRETLQITEQSGTSLLNYQVKITVLHQTGMQNNFADIRFTDIDGTTLLNHWLAFYQAGVSATFWVNIPILQANSSQNIFLYFDNAAASSASDGHATFLFFNDMNQLNQWNLTGNSVMSIDSSSYPGNYLIKKQGACDPAGAWIPLGGTVGSFRLLARELRVNDNSCKWNRYGLENNSFNGYSLRRKAAVNTVGEFGFERRTAGMHNNVRQTVLPQPRGQFYITELIKDCNSGWLQATLQDDNGNLIGQHDAFDNTYCTFDRFVMRGGVDYFFDHIAVAQYTENEPIVTFLNQLILLPLELLHFDATKTDDGHLIEWEIGQTDDILHFELAYSLDAINFETIYQFSVQELRYEIIDKNFYDAEQVYYRLKTVMIDGSVVYSDIKVLSIENKHQGISLAPNPARSYLTLRFYLDKSSDIQLILMDNNGRRLRSTSYALDIGRQALEINTAALDAGLYHLLIADGEHNRIRRFVKQ